MTGDFKITIKQALSPILLPIWIKVEIAKQSSQVNQIKHAPYINTMSFYPINLRMQPLTNSFKTHGNKSTINNGYIQHFYYYFWNPKTYFQQIHWHNTDYFVKRANPWTVSLIDRKLIPLCFISTCFFFIF